MFSFNSSVLIPFYTSQFYVSKESLLKVLFSYRLSDIIVFSRRDKMGQSWMYIVQAETENFIFYHTEILHLVKYRRNNYAPL